MTIPSGMPSASELLDAIKQQSQTYKKGLKIPLNEAQHITAKTGGFESWFELTRVIQTNPLDIRILACAFSMRSPASIMMNKDIQDEIGRNLDRFLELTAPTLEPLKAAELFALARGIKASAEKIQSEIIDPALAMRGISEQLAIRRTIAPRWETYAEPGRFTLVTGCAGAGKSVLAGMVGQSHVMAGKPVCFISMLESYWHSDSHPDDLGHKLRMATLTTDSHYQVLPLTGEIPSPLSRASFHHPKNWQSERERALVTGKLLENLCDKLMPGTLVIVDDLIIHVSSQSDEASLYSAIMRPISRLLEQGHAVMLCSQDIFDRELYERPLTGQQKDRTIVLAGRTNIQLSHLYPEKSGSSEEKFFAMAHKAERFEFVMATGHNYGAAVTLKLPVIDRHTLDSILVEGKANSLENAVGDPSYSPDFHTLLEQLDIAGVTITNRELMIEKVKASTQWTGGFFDVVRTGRKHGIQFWRSANQLLDDLRLYHILRGYPFPEEQRYSIIRNILNPEDYPERYAESAGPKNQQQG